MYKKILIIVQRSNGDVFLSSPLIKKLKENYDKCRIDLLINDDTIGIASCLQNVNNIHRYSYSWKKLNNLDRIKKEFSLIKNIYKKYDLSINLTASDRSVLYSILASNNSISAVEKKNSKSWWKKLFLKYSYSFDINSHIVINNIKALNFLKIKSDKIKVSSNYTQEAKIKMSDKLKQLNIKNFIIFHPSAQYDYKIYPVDLRNDLIKELSDLDVSILITGAKSNIDLRIKNTLPLRNNVHDFIGETNLDEYIALSDLSLGYIGMDTLNMHIATSQNKRIFAIFGPTVLATWSPWSNISSTGTTINTPKQTYDNITVFQANMACVACGKAGCDDKHGKSECLYKINPKIIIEEVKSWLNK